MGSAHNKLEVEIYRTKLDDLCWILGSQSSGCEEFCILGYNLCWVGPLSPQHGMCSGCRWRSVLQLWSVAVNMLSNQPWTDDKGLSSSLGAGPGAYSHSP
jgi:hypothetical protein